MLAGWYQATLRPAIVSRLPDSRVRLVAVPVKVPAFGTRFPRAPSR
jgi:hypothetical protein